MSTIDKCDTSFSQKCHKTYYLRIISTYIVLCLKRTRLNLMDNVEDKNIYNNK